MAYKQNGRGPITAKIKRTTQGGMVKQPMLNMGSPVKMKSHSPAKQGDKGTRSSATAHRLNPKTDKKQSEFTNLTFEQYRKSGLMKPGEAKFYKGGGTKRVKTSDLYKRKAKTEGGSIDNVAGGYFGNNLANKKEEKIVKKDSPKNNTPKVTGKAGSELRRQQYDKLGWAYDKTIKVKPKAKSKVEPAKTVGIHNVVKDSDIILQGSTKKPSKKAMRKADAADRKSKRAERVRQKGIDALASGNKTKARRLKRREERINKRAIKKREQAKNAL